MPGRIDSAGTRFRVICDDEHCDRPLDWIVDTEQYARNLVAKHDREHHAVAGVLPPEPAPELSYDVSAAAGIFLRSHDQGVASVWHALTGLRGQAAIDHAEHVHAHPTTAHVTPF